MPDYVCDGIEVAIVVQKREAVLDRDLRDQTVIAAARRLPSFPAFLINPSSCNMRFHRIPWHITKQAGKVLSPRFESLDRVRSLQDFLQDNRRGGDDILAGEEFI